jgi:hypothetical protein
MTKSGNTICKPIPSERSARKLMSLHSLNKTKTRIVGKTGRVSRGVTPWLRFARSRKCDHAIRKQEREREREREGASPLEDYEFEKAVRIQVDPVSVVRTYLCRAADVGL